jgi:hypothetical protein
MPIDSGPSFPQPPVEDINSKVEKSSKIKEANDLIDLVYDSGFNMHQQDEEFIESNSSKIVTVSRMLEEIRYGEPGYKEVFNRSRDIVEGISSKMGQLKTNSEDFGLNKSYQEELHSLMDQISETNDSQKIEELSEEAENIFRTNINVDLEKRDDIKRSRDSLVQDCEENSFISRTGLIKAGENISKEIDSGNVYDFVTFSRGFNNDLESDAQNISSKEFVYKETLEEAYVKFSNLTKVFKKE